MGVSTNNEDTSGTDVILCQRLHDWQIEQGDPIERISEQERMGYTLRVIKGKGALYLTVEPDNGESHPSLEVMVEINKGVPCLHVGNVTYGDNVAHLFAVNEGVAVVPESDNHPQFIETSRFYPAAKAHNTVLFEG